MSEEVVEVAPEVTEDAGDITAPEASGWWQFESKDAAVEWVNDKVQKRLAREKTKFDPVIAERDILKKRVEDLEPLEKATQSDAQRWEGERAFLTTELEELRDYKRQAARKDLVREIADDKGLPSRFISRVQGEDADSITADIEDLMTVLNDGKSKPPARKPQETDERPSSKGYGGGGSKTETDNKAVIDNIRKKAREQGHQTFTR